MRTGLKAANSQAGFVKKVARPGEALSRMTSSMGRKVGMNRSFHAFAVLLVSLAGGMIAATWTTTLDTRRPVVRFQTKGHASPSPEYCSCNPDGLTRLEQGCARDKTTGELYGCGLGLGNNVAGKSVLGRTANSATDSIAKGAAAIRQGIVGIPWQDIATQSSRLEMEVAAMHAGIPHAEFQSEATPDRLHEQDYAAAELAAAGYDPNIPSSPWLSPLYRAVSAEVVSQSTQSTLEMLGRVNRQWERQSRLWLVENGLHRQWDDAEEAALKEKLASARLQIEDENFDRWFENFPSPVTRPNRLINPIEPKDDSDESRRMILATAKVLETLSGLLHHTAENLARQAEQDVAELHKLKSGLEERR
jgi:hypothetical protein